MSEKKTYLVNDEKLEKRKIARLRLLNRMQANPNDSHHGTLTGYKTGCKCARCYRAWHDYQIYGPKRKFTARELVYAFIRSSDWEPKMTLRTIAEHVGVSKTSCSTAIHSLADAGLIIVDDKNKVIGCSVAAVA